LPIRLIVREGQPGPREGFGSFNFKFFPPRRL